MTGEGFPKDDMRYDALAQEALRQVIRAALERAASPQGLPGAHHFYITFKTLAPGTALPAEISSRYPDEMTIVLQHQFWDLKPEADQFSVVLQFGGEPKKLVIPYAAVTRFYDPSVQFLLQFEVTEVEPPKAAASPKPETPPAGEEPTVISLDAFRKK